VRTFFHEALGGGQANPAVSACDYRNFSSQSLSVISTHYIYLFLFFSALFLNGGIMFFPLAEVVIEFAEGEQACNVFPGLFSC
jgi:hypothetical protein